MGREGEEERRGEVEEVDTKGRERERKEEGREEVLKRKEEMRGGRKGTNLWD